MSAKKNYHSLDDDIEFTLFGLKTINIRGYLFIYQLNQKFGYQFTRIQDLNILKKDLEFHHEQYSFEDFINQNEYQIIQNLSLPTVLPQTAPNLFNDHLVQEYLVKKYQEFNLILKINLPLNEEFLLHLSADSNLLKYQEIDNQELTLIQKYIA